jgi:hypothetical protein
MIWGLERDAWTCSRATRVTPPHTARGTRAQVAGSRGTTIGPGTLVGDPAAVSWDAGRIDQFERGEDNTLYHRACSSAAGWSTRYSLGGILTSDPAVSSWGPGRLDVFARNNGNLISQRTYDSGAWQPWDTVGSGTVTSEPAAVSWGPGPAAFGASGSA